MTNPNHRSGKRLASITHLATRSSVINLISQTGSALGAVMLFAVIGIAIKGGP
jgi:hypothetical protein